MQVPGAISYLSVAKCDVSQMGIFTGKQKSRPCEMNLNHSHRDDYNLFCFPECCKHAGTDTGGCGTGFGYLVGVDLCCCSRIGVAHLSGCGNQINAVGNQRGCGGMAEQVGGGYGEDPLPC